MDSLQVALNERLKSLKQKKKKSSSKQKRDILQSLKKAGILNKKGKLINRVSTA